MSDQQKTGLRTINRQRWEAQEKARKAQIARNKSKGVSAMHAVAKASIKEDAK